MNNKWKKASQILKSHGVVILPSDSSFGIAALVSSQIAVQKLYKIKKREPQKASLAIVGSVEQAQNLVNFNSLSKKLTEKYWPGGLTIVLEAKDKFLPDQIYGQDHSLAVRFPNKKELSELALETGPFILPSANFAGLPAPFKIQELDPELIKLADYFLEEETDGNLVSTLVDLRSNDPIILRQGAVEIESKS